MATKRIAIISTTKESVMRILSSYDYYHIHVVWDEISSIQENIRLFDNFDFRTVINESGDYLDAELLCWLGVCTTYEDGVLYLHKLLDKYLLESKENHLYFVIADVHE